MISADLYLRLSDFRGDESSFEARERKLREKAEQLGWTVRRVVIENDLAPSRNGRSRPASAFKRVAVRDKRTGKVIRDPDTARPLMRVFRPAWQEVIADLKTGRAGAVLAEDLDRVARDPRDLEDLIDAVEARGASARSLSGSLTLTDGGTDSEITMARVMVAVGNKESRDKRRRVAEQRERTAQGGWYGGGRRPFGYRPDPDAPKFRKNLLVVPAEARVLEAAAATVLARGSLKAVARDLRDGTLRDADGTLIGFVPTVNGGPWTAETVKDVLTKPSVAGIAVHSKALKNGGDVTTMATEHEAQWPAILPRETWEAVRSILADPARRTTPGNEPRWLGTGIYLCGACDPPKATLRATGGKKHSGPGYVCANGNHLRRMAQATDNFVGGVIAARLALPDAADLLAPPPRPGIDTAALRAEAARLTAIGEAQASMHALGEITDAEFVAGSRTRRARLAAITAQLAASTETDPLVEFRGQPDARAVWAALPLGRKRAVLRLLATVTILPGRHGPGFHPNTVAINWLHPQPGS